MSPTAKNSTITENANEKDSLQQQTQYLSPFVFWAQTEQFISLKVDLRDCKKLNVKFGEKSLSFSTHGIGARGVHDYKFLLSFFSSIDENASCYKVYDSKVEFFIKKIDNAWWPRLIAQPQKPHWLKIDFDRWQSEDDIQDEPQRNVSEDYPGMYEKLQKEELGYIKEKTKKVYMIFYNFLQFIGYLYILMVLSVLYYRDGKNFLPHTWEATSNAMKFFQLLQYLEVMHPIFGYTKGGALIPFFQVTGRNFILFVMLDSEDRMQTKPVVFYVFLVWSLIEVVRYPYYISTIVKKENGLLTWLRYTLWIPLYPIGIVCEGIVILRNIPYFEETKRFSVEMPNKWNFAFDMPSFLKVYLMLLILPGTYMVMTHMSRTRAKKLNKTKLHSK